MFHPHSAVANVCGNCGNNHCEVSDRALKVTRILKQDIDAPGKRDPGRDDYDQVTNIPEEQGAAITSDGHQYADKACAVEDDSNTEIRISGPVGDCSIREKSDQMVRDPPKPANHNRNVKN